MQVKLKSIASVVIAHALALSAHSVTAVEKVLAPHIAKERLKEMRIEPTPDRLIQYAAQGDGTTVDLLLEAGVPVNARDELRHVSALHNAAAMGHVKLVEHLLEYGARVDAPDWRGVTPLVNAAYYGRDAIIAKLLEYHATIDVRPASAPTPLIAAIEAGSLSVVDRLLNAGANPALRDFSDTTPLQAAQRMNRGDIVARIEQALAKRSQ